MKYAFFLARKNLKRHLMRTMILVLSIATAITTITVTYNTSDSSAKQIKEQVSSGYTGKNQLANKNFSLAEDKIKLSKFMKVDEIPSGLPATTPRIYSPVFLATDTKTLGTMLIGIDPQKERKLTRIHESLTQGTELNDPEEKALILGKQLAQALEVKLGDEIILLSQGVDGSVANDLFIVKGIMNLGSAELEEKMIIIPIGAARSFLSMPEGSFHTLLARDNFSSDLSVKFNLMTWETLLPDVIGPVALFERFLSILSFALTFVICVGVANTLYVSFNERQPELEALNILGAKPGWIIQSLFFEVLVLLALGAAAGILGALLFTQLYHVFPMNFALLMGRDHFLLGGLHISPLIKVLHFPMNYLKGLGVVVFFYLTSAFYPLITVTKQIKR